MDLGLKGRRALITGGTKSIGRAIVDAFAEGAVVGFCARDAKLVRQREEERKAKQARVEGTALDVTNDSILTKWIDGFAAEGGIDHCVANLSALGTDDTPEGWRKSIEIDIVSTLESVRHAMPHLLKNGPRNQDGATCTIIGTVSLVEAGPGPVQAYRSAKAALVPFMKSLSIEMAPKGARGNVISPGSILEDGNIWGRQRNAGSERYKRTFWRNPMGRMGTPQEVAAPVVFLAGAPSSFITGINFVVDCAITTRVQY